MTKSTDVLPSPPPGGTTVAPADSAWIGGGASDFGMDRRGANQSSVEPPSDAALGFQ